MARRFAKVSEEEIKTTFFYPSDLVNTKTTIPLRVGEERWIYTSTLRVSVYIHYYSPPLRGIVVYYQPEARDSYNYACTVHQEITIPQLDVKKAGSMCAVHVSIPLISLLRNYRIFSFFFFSLSLF